MTYTKFLLAALCAAALIAPRAAQAGEVRHREIHQQQRIDQGARSGQLTRGEYDRLQYREARLNDQRVHDLAKNGGRLTGPEAHQLNREENRLSHAIYRDKHNARTVNPPR